MGVDEIERAVGGRPSAGMLRTGKYYHLPHTRPHKRVHDSAGSAAGGVLQGCPRVLQPFPLCLVSAPGARPLQPVLALQAVRDVFQVFLSLDAGRFFSAVQICFRSCTCL